MTAGRDGREGPVIGLLGQYSSRNLGDAAIVTEIIRNLRERVPGVRFVAICARPDDAVRTFGMPAFPISGHGAAYREDGSPWSEADPPTGPAAATRRAFAVAAKLDLLVMAGGGQVDDYWGGVGEQPRSLATWSLLARLRRIPVAFLSVGVDQLASRLSRQLVLFALRRASLLSFRDEGSCRLLADMGLRRRSEVYPDPAFGATRGISGARAARTRVLLSPICRRSWPGASVEQHERYLDEFAVSARALIDDGLDVRFACSQITMDPEAVTSVTSRLERVPAGAWSVARVETFEDFVREAGEASLVVSSRLHGVILGLVAGTPVVALSVARKVDAVMADVELDDYCLQAALFDAPLLLERCRRALAQSPALTAHIQTRVARLADQLPAAYDAVVRLLPPRSAA
jgi:polysaccharide pyruvyl transferase WcaK-like protein